MPQTLQAMIDTATQIRRQIHQQPELGWHETSTANIIRTQLKSLDIEWKTCTKTGTIADIRCANNNAKTIALRADIDALPLQEQNEFAWRSKTDGCMHACGHDGHTATLLAAAAWIKTHQNKLNCNIRLIFQPAEEGGHGAKHMIEAGALEGVDEIYGWHNWPPLPFGQMLCPDDIVMCGNGTFKITLSGQGGHASQPELCTDALLAASALHLNLQQIPGRKTAAQNAVVVSVTQITSDSQGPTIIGNTATIEGSIRIPDKNTRAQVQNLIKQISEQTALLYQVDCKVELFPRYEATINHPQQAANTRSAWQQIGAQCTLADNRIAPIMASEDFSYYLQQIPGSFALIGAAPDKKTSPPCHSTDYDFNDNLIPLVCKLFARISGVPVP
ncbi:N(2)-acetyl-L-2,4-diaminobutanoate deacetylase DoeB2 [Gayadomonas joobiniege]|uniref:N(2)-acetyl-L-2,4-diaminobutanoate deacetylase DoeB2 n=1 Tax=Gayadomonas joobiniege TaxID=1234606 RepID=UPI0003634E76|nr:N(2)-acetyl-L-2,4-diaminobutanoate deacetylase DoeB2 [Gayadomonas joobiniege]